MLTDSQIWKALNRPGQLSLLAGPCVVETEKMCFEVARTLKKTCQKLGINYIFKASYDKANRSSGQSFRGPGMKAGLAVLAKIRKELDLPIVTDVHSEQQVAIAAEVADVLQIPAFLCRQTDLIEAAVATGKIVNIKKGQFLSPQEMGLVVKKAAAAGGKRVMITERGTTFGYNNLRGRHAFDSDHEAKWRAGDFRRDALGAASGRWQAIVLGGQREMAPVLAKCAIAAGRDWFVHRNTS